MKKSKDKKLQDFTKEELIEVVKNLDIQLQNATKAVASYRHILKIEFRTPHEYWEKILEVLSEDEFEEPVPPGYKEPQMKSKKKETEVGYS